MPVDRLDRQLVFLGQIDALKIVIRQSHIVGRSRRENSAEHSWHLAMFALVLGEDASVDVGRTMAMLLIHDIVEIDAGDAPLHGDHDMIEIERREREAASRLFCMLPADQAERLLALWREFEAAESPEARFAKALDRLQPLLLNTLTAGSTWAESGVGEEDVRRRYGPTIERGSPPLWSRALELVERHFAGSGDGPPPMAGA